MPKNELLWTDEDWEKIKWDTADEDNWVGFKAQHFVPVAHNAELVLASVYGNEQGDREYTIVIRDSKGLEHPIAVSVLVEAEGGYTCIVENNPDEVEVTLKQHNKG
jgi:hypothetical protein